LNEEAVTIHDNERALSDYAWECGIDPLPKAAPDAPLTSVVGSGPAGLAAAWELARRGMRVRVCERDDRTGGLLIYGIPNMKLPKWVVDRRVRLMEESGIEFRCNVDAAAIAGSSRSSLA
jgi:glutamate synthase (NADPH/NADH) small chain